MWNSTKSKKFKSTVNTSRPVQIAPPICHAINKSLCHKNKKKDLGTTELLVRQICAQGYWRFRNTHFSGHGPHRRRRKRSNQKGESDSDKTAELEKPPARRAAAPPRRGPCAATRAGSSDGHNTPDPSLASFKFKLSLSSR